MALGLCVFITSFYIFVPIQVNELGAEEHRQCKRTKLLVLVFK